MSERGRVHLRIVVIALVVANLMAFAYAVFAPDPRARAGTRVEELQINPGRIKLMGSATRGPGGSASGKAGAYRACVEWGPFTGADIAKADSALARLVLAHPPVQRPLSEVGGVKRYAYFVREPDAASVAQIAELQRAFPGTEIKAGPCPG